MKKKILIASIINLIATFLPYGLMLPNKLLFIWQQIVVDNTYSKLKEIIINEVNRWNAIIIYVFMLLLMLNVIFYLKTEKVAIKKSIRWFALANIGANVFSCYHFFEISEFKYINVGLFLSIMSCVYIVWTVSGVNKNSILYLMAVLLATFPTIIQIYSVDIEGTPDIFCFSAQSYFYVFYECILTKDLFGLYSIPMIILVIITVIAVINVVGNFEKRLQMVKLQIVFLVLSLIVELLVMFVSKELSYITLTYPLAIIIISIYVRLEKKKSNVLQQEN